MYNVPYFKANNEQEVFDFMHAHPFVTVISKGDQYPVATHVPVIIEERDGKMILRAHIMRKTDHHLAMEKNPNVLIIFSGEHAYVSASWYTNQQVGSTWNYRVVHAQGTVVFTDQENLLDLLTKLTEKFENNSESPSLVKHLSGEYIDSMMKAIVAFEIEITNIDHVFKLSQNRDNKSYQNIIAQLNKGTPEAKSIAEVMKENRSIG